MILAARTAHTYWEIAGTWLKVERAEYRLAMTYLKAEILTEAFGHAETCLAIGQEHYADPLEFFFGYEALALVEKKRGNTMGYYGNLDGALKEYDTAIAADDYHLAYENKATILIRLRRYGEAKEFLVSAFRKLPGNAN